MPELIEKEIHFGRLGAGGFKEEKMGLGFKSGIFVKDLGLFGPWNDLLGLGSLSCYIRERLSM
jgi:hypothetical protein